MTALALLLQIMEYENKEGDIGIKECLPKQLRLTQIISLAQALGYYDVSTSIATAWQEPGVLNNIYHSLKPKRDAVPSPVLKEKILSYVTEYHSMFKDRAVRWMDIEWMFRELYDYRKEVMQLLATKNGMMEGFSGGLFFAHHLIGFVNETIANSLEAIDDTLWELVDPAKRVLEKYPESYPDEEMVESAELQWRIDNY